MHHELLAASKMADTGLGIVAFDQAGKHLASHEVEDLGENEAPGVHRATWWLSHPAISKA